MPKKNKKKVKSVRQPNPSTSRDSRNEAGASASKKKNIEVEYLEVPVKSDTDCNEYRVIRLPNGLTALLASVPSDSTIEGDVLQDVNNASDSEESKDETGQKSRLLEKLQDFKESSSEVLCSLSINVGHFGDPRQYPGISRIVSTLVPKHSRKYPLPNDAFPDIVNWEDTERNAETSMFSFGVDKNKLREALDRFTQCFISPLIKRDHVADTIEDILFDYEEDSETEQYFYAKIDAIANASAAKHPVKMLRQDYLKGLEDIPEDKVYREVLKFRERHYSANRMNVFIMAELSLDVLEEVVKEYFSAIPSNGSQPRDNDHYNFLNSFDSSKFCRIYEMKPIRSNNSAIELTWPLPPSQWLYRCKPYGYISRILSDSGEGSLSSYLKEKEWCTKLTSEVENLSDFRDNSMYSLLELTIDVTDQGLKNGKSVICAVYSYINLMRQNGPQQQIYEEFRDMEEARFRFQRNEMEMGDYETSEICGDMHRHEPVDYLTGKHLYYEFDPISIETCTSLLTPERANVIFYDKNYNASRVKNLESCPFIFKELLAPIKYREREIPEDWMESWKNAKPLPEFNLPKANVFRSNDFTLIKLPENLSSYPNKIYSDDSSEIWYKPDAKFRLPYCHLNFFYVSLLPLMSPENAAMMDLYVTILKHLLTEDLKHASDATLFYKINARERGLEVLVHGMSQKTPLVMEKITNAMANCCERLTEILFGSLKKTQLDKYVKILTDRTELVDDIKLSALRRVHWSFIDKHAALSDLGFGKFQQFHKQFASSVYVKCLVQGNIAQADVLENARKYSEILNYGPLLTDNIPQIRFNEISRGERCFRIKSPDSEGYQVVANYYQFNDNSIHLSVMIDLLREILSSYEFGVLRKMINVSFQGHYIEKDETCVTGYTWKNLRYDSIVGAVAEEDAMIEIIRKAVGKLSNTMTDSEWQDVTEFAESLLYKPYNDLSSEVGDNWKEIISGEYIFDRRARYSQAVKEIKVEDLRKFFSILTSDGSEMRKLSIQIVPCKDKQSNQSKDKSSASCKLSFLTNLPEEKNKRKEHKTKRYFVMDIEAYKRGLNLLPIVNQEVSG